MKLDFVLTNICRSASLSKNQLNKHLSIKKALFVVKEKKDQKSTVAWALFLTETQIKSPQVMKNAENFSTKALAIKVVLFAIWWSVLAYESQKLLKL